MIDGVLMIRDSTSPTLVRAMLLAYLPEKHCHDAEEGGGHGWFVTFADLMGPWSASS